MTLNIGSAQVVFDLGQQADVSSVKYDDQGIKLRLQGGNPNNIQSMPPGALQPTQSDLRHYNDGIQAQEVHGKMAMRENSMDLDDSTVGQQFQQYQDAAGNGGGMHVQRTQLLNLQPAGGKKNQNSSHMVTDLQSTDVLHEDDLEQMSSQQLHEIVSQVTAKAQTIANKKRKRGHTHKHLTMEEEMKFMVYKMITDLFDFEQLKKKKDFAIKRYKESLYRGELVSGNRHGQGICVYEIGRVYEGEWLDDKRHGQGYERFSNGNQYLGQYDKGTVSGKGLYTWVSGDTYDGEWVNGIKHGYGVWKGIGGDSYIGQWVQNKAHGYGQHEWANGDRYEGEWKYCLRHGQGSDTFANGDVYLGEYNYGKANGYGQYRWFNGNTYSGIFVEGMKEGKGVWQKSGTDEVTNTYEGEYHQDMKHGLGEFRWASGGYYKGRYEHDVKLGFGEMYWADGSIYRGSWERGIQNGLGIMIFANGTRKAGIFRDNVLVELLMNQEMMDQIEATMIQEQNEPFPEAFRQELKEYIGLMNPKEDNRKFLDRKYQDAGVEDKIQPNTLLEMQELPNAPWNTQGDAGDGSSAPGMTREEYIAFVKNQEILEQQAALQEEQAHLEPQKLQAPMVSEIGVQVDPPPVHVSTQMTPPATSESIRQSNPSMFRPHMQMQSNPMTSHGKYNQDPSVRQDPINYYDAKDHRNQINGPDLAADSLPQIGNGMSYHDFDYVGYQTRNQINRSSERQTRLQTLDLPHQQLNHHSPRQRNMREPQSTLNRYGGTNPRRHEAPVTQQGFASSHHQHSIKQSPPSHSTASNQLPDIIRRGPINNSRNTGKNIVGLSLQQKNPYPKFAIKDKRISKNNDNTGMYRNSKPRNELLNAQKKPPINSHPSKHNIRSPKRNGSMQPRNAEFNFSHSQEQCFETTDKQSGMDPWRSYQFSRAQQTRIQRYQFQSYVQGHYKACA